MADEQIERVTEALAGSYEVQHKLGEGGMATVYLARDVKHDRQVAVKVLHPDLAASLGAERFLREIQITAKLSHPHILPLFDSGEANGVLYYVMPLVEGETLSEYMVRERQLAIPEAVKIAQEVAGALAQAHSYGLVHRDIKPSNIMMTGGHAVVADFGIARALEEAGDDKLTQTGMSVGTPAYMSPEQAMGGNDVDGRSDIYSLGCVLYEMLVGQIPFTGPTPQAIIARHSMDHISPPSIMRDTIPADLEAVIYTSMAKTPADRYRTAQEFAEALGQIDTSPTAQRLSSARTRPSTVTATVPAAPRPWPLRLLPAGAGALVLALAWIGWTQLSRTAGGGAGGAATNSTVAVMYLEDLSSDGELGYLADGLTEGLIANLSAVPNLSVISRNGVQRFRDTDLPRDSVASLLGAGTMVVGSVERASGNRVTVTTRLVDGETGADVGSRESFTLPRDQLIAAQDSVVENVARILRAWLGAEIALRERRAATESAAAWAGVQRAERLTTQARDRAGEDPAAARTTLKHADSLLADAEAADPSWDEPTILRAQIEGYLGRLAPTLPDAVGRLATGIAHVERALAAAPSSAKALEIRGTLRRDQYYRGLDGGFANRDSLLAAAYRDLREAVRIDPTLASAHATLSFLHYDRKDVYDAMLAARAAYEADRFLANADLILDRLFWSSYDIAQFPEARRWCREGNRRFPEDYRFTACQLWLMLVPNAGAGVDDAWLLARRLDSLVPASNREFFRHLAQFVVGGVIGQAGLADSADRVLRAARTTDPRIDPEQELAGYEAIMRSLMGQDALAMDLLKRYVATHPGHSFQRGGMLHWWWQGLSDHPEFQAVLAPR